jgi:hypothetical protein
MALVWALVYFGGAAAAHAALTRSPRGNPITKFLVAGGAGGLVLACHLLVARAPGLAFFAALGAYAFAGELYLFLFTMVGSSVSARLLLLLRERNLSDADIAGLYEPRGMVERRMERLAAAGLLRHEGDRCRVTERGRRLANVFVAVKHFFRHPQDPPLQAAA